MRFGSWLLALLAVALIATVPVPRDVPPLWRPDLFVILAVFAALRAEARTALPLCWLTGLAQDLLSAGPPGQYALLYLAAGAAIVAGRAKLDSRSALTAVTLVSAVVAATECVAAWVSGREGLWPAPGAFRGIAGASLVTACVALPAFHFLDRVHFFSRRLKSPVSGVYHEVS